MVINIGYRTYDITILKMNETNFSEIFLLRDYFLEKNNKNFLLKKNLKKYCKEIKIKLSKEKQIKKEIKLLMNHNLKITRNEFANVCSDLFEKILNPINEIFQNSCKRSNNLWSKNR